jgi:hypothetical protein
MYITIQQKLNASSTSWLILNRPTHIFCITPSYTSMNVPVIILIDVSYKLMDKVPFDFNLLRKSMNYLSSSRWFTQTKCEV